MTIHRNIMKKPNSHIKYLNFTYKTHKKKLIANSSKYTGRISFHKHIHTLKHYIHLISCWTITTLIICFSVKKKLLLLLKKYIYIINRLIIQLPKLLKWCKKVNNVELEIYSYRSKKIHLWFLICYFLSFWEGANINICIIGKKIVTF